MLIIKIRYELTQEQPLVQVTPALSLALGHVQFTLCILTKDYNLRGEEKGNM